MIELRAVCATAGAFQLRNVTFFIPAGAFGVVIGAAGAGKTTLLECIAGVRQVSDGRILLGTRDVTTLPPEQRRTGLVYQRGALFTHKTVLENLTWSAQSKGAMASTAESLIERFELSSIMATPVAALSGGERQLVALVRALVRVRGCLDRSESAVLLLDEPFSALDPRRRRVTRALVRELHHEWALTSLQVTHDGAEAGTADVAVLVEGGAVVQSGTPEDMMARPARDDVPLFLS